MFAPNFEEKICLPSGLSLPGASLLFAEIDTASEYPRKARWRQMRK